MVTQILSQYGSVIGGILIIYLTFVDMYVLEARGEPEK